MSLAEDLLALHDALKADGIMDQEALWSGEPAQKAEFALLIERSVRKHLKSLAPGSHDLSKVD